ncbi:uncharacterized protein DSM5745_09498 [Aspergillus mulundensis]|uniref:F-box domain-containing protein n=1 Tax=Aspergillus mulundensis TaxID=1810919 RepID=A0A3D8QVG8_9EURO|nr:hypothetical protein DSM5745_09498 [Aspergillus mulundensis]RDW65759.1 hypothetical protein DSM5745_09498 [Aspergillus mulundensis]
MAMDNDRGMSDIPIDEDIDMDIDMDTVLDIDATGTGIDITRATPRLAGLPAELLELIASHLDTNGFKQLRLTSKRLCISTGALFGRRHFSDVTTDLSAPSLQRLQAFSTMHPNLASHVKEFIATTTIKPEGCNLGGGFLWSRDQTTNRLNGIPTGFLQGWQATLKGLPNCKSFSMVRPFHYHYSLFLQGHVDFAAAEGNYPILSCSETFDVMLKVIADASIPLESFKLNLNNYHALEMACVDTTFLTTQTFLASWSTLKRLDISVQVRNAEISNYLTALITLPKNLESLSITLSGGDSASALLANLARAYTDGTCAPALKTLYLEEATIPQRSLSKILLANRTSLQGLALHYIQLDEHGSVALLKTLRDGAFAKLTHLTLRYGLETRSDVEAGTFPPWVRPRWRLEFPGISEGEDRDPVCGKGFSYRLEIRGGVARSTVVFSGGYMRLGVVLQRLIDRAQVV